MKSKSRIGYFRNDWFFLVLLSLIGLLSMYTYIRVIPLDLGLASLIVLLVILFFSLEDIMPNARKVRKRKFNSKK